MNKKVLVISNMYPTEQHKSFGVFVKNQVEELKRQGLAVDVIAITDPQSGKVNVLKKYLLWAIQNILIFLFKGYRYDAVHAHYVFPSGVFASLYKKLWRKRMIVTAHGGDIDKMARKNERIFRYTKKILTYADEVIAVGEQLKQEIINDFGIPSTKVSVLNMGVNRQVFQPMDKSLARANLAIKEQALSILFVGNIIKQKGLLELVEALHQLRQKEVDGQLYIIGPEKDATFKQELTERIEQLHVQPYVHFLGVNTQQEIAKWMAAADVFVLPSHIEGFGLVALEAMSCGTPVVGTKVGGLQYLLANDTGCLVEPKNADSLAAGIEKVWIDKNYRQTLIENGLKKAEQNDAAYLTSEVKKLYFPTGG
jgi:glycosyltransferase involved in cell wall biosynthesis